MLFSILLTSISGALFPFFLGKMINSLLYGRDYVLFFRNFCLYGAFFLVQQLMRFINTRQYAVLETTLLFDIRRDTLKNIFSKSAGYLSQMDRGDTISRIEKDVHQILDYIYFNLFYSISDIFEFASQIVLILRISWKLLILTIICMPISFLLPRFCSGILKRYYQKQSEIDGKLTGWFFDIINSLVDIRLLSGEQKVNFDYLKQKENYISIRKSTTRIETFTQIGIEGTAVILKILLYSVSAFLVIRKEMLIGNFISVIEYFNSSLTIFNEIANRTNPITENMVAIDRVRNIISLPQDVFVPEIFASAASDIRFENVNFRYKKEGPQILNNLSFYINPGEHVVFAGESGCGKTTITRLMMNFYSHDNGNIYIGNMDMKQNKNVNLSSKIGVVFQTTAIFEGSIRYNLIFSDNMERDNEIWLVLERVGLSEYINSLTSGLSTELSGLNTHLSGGQIQRIGISRTLLKNTDIIIFDEPTSAFDWKSEQVFLEMCQAFYRQKTIIMISHRVETLKAADRVYFIKNGKIEAVGKHEELLAKNSDYVKYLNKGELANEK
ncbi:MAG: ABC transporter ATP-binding protein/permease [Clostridiales bacterium]|nr:ABC transporter ATP-binding protein/permease [Clostridiales bacterium]